MHLPEKETNLCDEVTDRKQLFEVAAAAAAYKSPLWPLLSRISPSSWQQSRDLSSLYFLSSAIKWLLPHTIIACPSIWTVTHHSMLRTVTWMMYVDDSDVLISAQGRWLMGLGLCHSVVLWNDSSIKNVGKTVDQVFSVLILKQLSVYKMSEIMTDSLTIMFLTCFVFFLQPKK